MGIDAAGGDRPLTPAAVVPATECRGIPSRVGVGGTWPFEYRLTAWPGPMTGGMLGSVIEDNLLRPAVDPDRETGGALWMTGCSWLSLAVRGEMTRSAGLPLPPPSWRLARRRAKLIGGAGRACDAEGTAELDAEGCRCVCVGGESVAGRGGGGCCGCDRGPDVFEGVGGGLGCRDEEDMACVGAPEEPATIDRRGPASAAGGLGLRPPPLVEAAFVDGGGGCSSDEARGLTMLTSGGAVGGTMPAVLPRRCSIRACCCCFRFIMDLTCSNAFGSSPRIVKPITTGEIPLSTEGRLTSVLMPLIVTRRFLDGLGEDVEEEEAVSVSFASLWMVGPPECGGGRDSLSVSCLTLTAGCGDRRMLQSANTKRYDAMSCVSP